MLRKALEYMERAFFLDETDARVLMELDQLYKKLQRPHAERLAFLQNYPELIEQRDDLVLEEITLLNQTGRYAEAKGSSTIIGSTPGKVVKVRFRFNIRPLAWNLQSLLLPKENMLKQSYFSTSACNILIIWAKVNFTAHRRMISSICLVCAIRR